MDRSSPELFVLEAELGRRVDPVRRTDDAPLEEDEERPPSTESSSSIFLSENKHCDIYSLSHVFVKKIF